MYKGYNSHAFTEFTKGISLFSGIAIIILSFIVGQFFDSIRDYLIEDKILSKIVKTDINWDFFYNSSDKEINRLSNGYFLFYLVNVNLALVTIGFLIMILIGWPNKIPVDFIMTKISLITSCLIVILVLLLDACVLRKDIAKHTNAIKTIDAKLDRPHNNVYTRIGISKIKNVNGVGVFAIIDIPKDTFIFQGDKSVLLWFTKKEIDFDNLSEPIKKLYDDFCVRKRGKVFKFGCPDNFNNMPISWYLNNSDNPNVGCNDDYDFFALTDIKAGEELVAKYDTYSDEE